MLIWITITFSNILLWTCFVGFFWLHLLWYFINMSLVFRCSRQVNIAVNCLSTDFSNQKGVKVSIVYAFWWICCTLNIDISSYLAASLPASCPVLCLACLFHQLVSIAAQCPVDALLISCPSPRSHIVSFTSQLPDAQRHPLRKSYGFDSYSVHCKQHLS